MDHYNNDAELDEKLCDCIDRLQKKWGMLKTIQYTLRTPPMDDAHLDVASELQAFIDQLETDIAYIGELRAKVENCQNDSVKITMVTCAVGICSVTRVAFHRLKSELQPLQEVILEKSRSYQPRPQSAQPSSVVDADAVPDTVPDIDTDVDSLPASPH